jgi:hypothetical protein
MIFVTDLTEIEARFVTTEHPVLFTTCSIIKHESENEAGVYTVRVRV